MFDWVLNTPLTRSSTFLVIIISDKTILTRNCYHLSRTKREKLFIIITHKGESEKSGASWNQFEQGLDCKGYIYLKY